jgi:uncharacterized membrane protein YkoI
MKRTAILSALAAVSLILPGLAHAEGRGRPPWTGRPDGDSLGADWRPQQDEARQGVRQGRMLPLESIVPRIARRAPGRMLDTGIESRGPQVVYRVRWQAADGRRIDYIVDAATGAILGADGE